MTARRFLLERDRDVTGVSGTGHVAEDVIWTDGTVDVHWPGARPSWLHWRTLGDAQARSWSEGGVCRHAPDGPRA